MTNMTDVRLIDVTLRDAHQCLWATRMTTGMMRSMAPALDDAGFEAIDLVGGAVFDVCVRYLREDPWERMRILSDWITKTPLIIHTRGQSLFTFEFFHIQDYLLNIHTVYFTGRAPVLRASTVYLHVRVFFSTCSFPLYSASLSKF